MAPNKTAQRYPLEAGNFHDIKLAKGTRVPHHLIARVLCYGRRPLSLRVFGCLPVSGRRGCTEAGVRKASREETAGEFILKAWCQVATSGRHHPPVQHDAPVSAFEAIAKDYPVFRIDPARPT